MLSSLLIKNYALIRHLEMHPAPGLNVITGETGAGKSIMLGAIGLLMGKRADTRVLLHKEHKCLVEGTFNVQKYGLRPIFQQNDWEYDPQTIIRREISASGKSRSFINDSPVNLDALRSLGEHLMDVHSQNDTAKLGGQEFQLQVLDLFGGNQELVENYRQVYGQWISLKKEHQQTLARSREQQQEADYKKFLLDELEAAHLDQLDQKQLEESLQVMENAEEIKLQLQGSLQILDEGDFAVQQQLSVATQILAKIQRFAPAYQALKERLDSARIEIADVNEELRNLDENVDHDPVSIEQTKSTLDTIYRLQRKHHVDSVNELIEIRENLVEESQQLLHLDEVLEKLAGQIKQAESELKRLGTALKNKRQAIFPEFKGRMEQLLGKLGMQECNLTVNSRSTDPGAHGIEEMEWLFSANKGIEPQPISKVASGGEFSRLMFCVKFLIAGKTSLPTILFDEIDTGISGEVALQMIEMMDQMSQNHQVITISHLPQFAARGERHYSVFKESDENTTISGIKILSGQERVEAIARMLAGNNPSELAYANAREMMGTGEQGNSRTIEQSNRGTLELGNGKQLNN